MDILDRLLRHDAWTTRQLLLRCKELSHEQLHRRFDVGHETVYATIEHLIGNMEVWNNLMQERPVRQEAERVEHAVSIDEFIERLDEAAADFEAFARKITDSGKLDGQFTDVLAVPPHKLTFGGTIAHLITHSLTHRVEILHMLQRLGLHNLPEGDVLSWEEQDSREREIGEF
jgi:uncharacterized damage-inducible protein DinB